MKIESIRQTIQFENKKPRNPSKNNRFDTQKSRHTILFLEMFIKNPFIFGKKRLAITFA